MRARLLSFVATLRAHGLEVSPAETMDALAAVAAAGVERETLREALAATLVKDERERAAFDGLFDAAFPLRGTRAHAGGGRRRGGGTGAAAEPRGGGAGEASGPGGAGGGRATTPSTSRAAVPATGRAARRQTPERAAAGVSVDAASGASADGAAASRRDARVGAAPDTARAAEIDHAQAGVAPPGDVEPDGGQAGDVEPAAARAGAAQTNGAARAAGRRARQAALLAMPFAAMTAADVAEARALVAALGARLRGRLARRERSARRGRLDLRRTLRAATTTGGVPLRLRRRGRRPGRPDLVALCDLSGSVAAASELLLGLLAPAAACFRRADTFAYVDRLCAVSIEDGHVAPAAPLDLYGRSDFGRVLADLWASHADRLARTTLLLVLGDARNNRLPPRGDLWRRVAARVGRIVWLVPEPRARWDTGDSVLALYAPACDALVECLDLATLVAAVRDALA